MNKQCAYCKKSFFIRHQKAKFCSRLCSDKGRILKVMVNCKKCGKEFRDIENKKAKPRKFCSQKCFYEYEIGKNHASWKGGRLINFQGYIFRYLPQHFRANSTGYILEHRFVMEEYLGRRLSAKEIVHHKNKNRKDNRIENLEILSRSEHNKKHFSILNNLKKRWRKEN